MPIRINLLAEEQAAEEMRRRDPVKRAIYAGAVAVALMIGWIVLTQVKLVAARKEVAATETRLKTVEESAKSVRANQFQVVDIDSRLQALEKYSSNRFFWASFLDAVQRAAVEDIKLIDINANQGYRFGDVNRFFTTNIPVKYSPPPPFWKFWASASAGGSPLTMVSNVFSTFTNSLPFTTNMLPYKVTTTIASTNRVKQEIAVKAEFNAVPWAQEVIVVEIKGKDYGKAPGDAIDEFVKRINSSEYFKRWLHPAGGLRFLERPPQAIRDPQDLENPDATFVPFTIELRLKERILTNE